MKKDGRLDDGGRHAWFAHQVGRMNIGDSFACDSSGWRVDRVINVANGKVKYQVFSHDKEITSRQRIDAVVSFLCKNNVPTTMKLIEKATVYNRRGHYDYDYIGMSHSTPIHDESITSSPLYRHTKTKKYIYFSPFVSIYKLAEKTFLHISFFIRQNQNRW